MSVWHLGLDCSISISKPKGGPTFEPGPEKGKSGPGLCRHKSAYSVAFRYLGEIWVSNAPVDCCDGLRTWATNSTTSCDFPLFWIRKGHDVLHKTKARCKNGLELHELLRPPYNWHISYFGCHISYGKDCTSVKLAQDLHGARTISHYILKIILRPCVNPQGQGKLTFRTHPHGAVTLRSTHTLPRN